MNIVFIGSQTIGFHCIEKLLQLGASVSGIVTFAPETHETWGHSLVELAQARGIPLFVAQGRDYVEFVKEKTPDVILVAGWRHLIPQEVLELPSLGAIGFHASMLPKYRGFAPLNWAILQGEKKTGITAFYLAEGVDTGDILAQKEVDIGPDEYIATLKERIDQKAVEIVEELYPLLEAGNAPRRKQDHAQASYGCLRVPEDGKIDWNQPAERICRLVRSLAHPYPGAFTTYRGKRVVIWKASLDVSSMPVFGRPGQVAFFHPGKPAHIVTGEGLLCVEEVQEGTGPRMPAGDYLKSLRVRLGDADGMDWTPGGFHG